jgi:hypothetical protein
VAPAYVVITKVSSAAGTFADSRQVSAKKNFVAALLLPAALTTSWVDGCAGTTTVISAVPSDAASNPSAAWNA